jgi:hypothetical protein
MCHGSHRKLRIFEVVNMGWSRRRISKEHDPPHKYRVRQYLVDKPDPELRPVLHLISHQNFTFKSPGFMEERSIVLYLDRKGLIAQVIHDDLVPTLGEEATAYSTVTDSLRAALIIPCDGTPFSAATSPHIDESDEAILRALEELPFSSVRQLSRATYLPNTMGYRRLSEKLGFTARHIGWVRQILFDDQKAKRLQCSKALLTILGAQETRDW